MIAKNYTKNMDFYNCRKWGLSWPVEKRGLFKKNSKNTANGIEVQ